MTLQQFLTECQNYYGKYRAGALAHVQHYLSQYRDYEFDALWKRVLLDYSGRWNYPPDIAILEEAARVLDKDSPGYSRAAWLPGKQVKQLPDTTDGEREEGAKILTEWKQKVMGK